MLVVEYLCFILKVNWLNYKNLSPVLKSPRSFIGINCCNLQFLQFLRLMNFLLILNFKTKVSEGIKRYFFLKIKSTETQTWICYLCSSTMDKKFSSCHEFDEKIILTI